MRSVLAALLLVLTCALPVAALGSVTLSIPTATPTSGTTATDVMLKVTYRSAEGHPATAVQVVVAGHAYTMHAPAGADGWGRGVRFSVTTHLPAGTWTSEFSSSREACPS